MYSHPFEFVSVSYLFYTNLILTKPLWRFLHDFVLWLIFKNHLEKILFYRVRCVTC